jgi:predicted PurR-regulated permease PerM
MAASQIGGVLGMIFAVPIYTLLRIVFKEFFGQYFIEDNGPQTTDSERTDS